MNIQVPTKLETVNARRQIHTCDVCGHIGYWGPEWGWVLLKIGRGMSGSEYIWKMCSKQCEQRDEKEKLKEQFKKDLNK